jgi:Fe-S-cluster containining protein
MPVEEFKCRRCGKCCKENWEITLDFQKDILRWIQDKRFDILRKVVLNPKFVLSPHRYDNEPQWMLDCGHVLFGDVTHKCPFLGEAVGEHSAGCRIHDTRPQVCRKFPFDENKRVRADILDLCVGSIFYHSRAAELEGLSFIEYINKIDRKKPKGPSLAPGRQELREIAHFFEKKNLKIRFTSDKGLNIAEKSLTKSRHVLPDEILH